jgi:hypothetical protein
MTRSRESNSLTSALTRGAIGGMIAGMAMAMFAMVASVTYQHHGFFTPLFHISALAGSPKSMMTSMNEAMAGNRFWFVAGPAFVGLMIHMVTGAAYGMVFARVARRLHSSALVPFGILFGLATFLVSSFVGLRIAATITGAGTAISDMAKMVGWSTFALEHLMFGLVLGAVALRWTPTGTGTADSDSGVRSAMLTS